MKVAVFVEGGFEPPRRGGVTPLEELWLKTLLPQVGCTADCLLIPISKKTIVALDPAQPKMSGAAEAFDQLFVRTLQKTAFDRAIVAWDLVPAWNPGVTGCRRSEVLDFFRYMASSTCLAAGWKQYCHSKYQSLMVNHSVVPPPALKAGEIGVVVMEPMFEDILVQSEAGFRTVVGNFGKPKPKGWPNVGWGGGSKRPDTEVVAPAVAALRGVKPKPHVVGRIRGDFRTAKNEWAEYLVRHMLADQNFRAVITGHAIAQRVSFLIP